MRLFTGRRIGVPAYGNRSRWRFYSLIPGAAFLCCALSP
jgi:hypothetical protein